MSPETLLAHHDAGTPWSADERRTLAADLATAYRTALAVRELRIARGERPAGFKIGFTNRTIWQRYGVYAPIWGTVWDTSLTVADAPSGEIGIAGCCQPRLEPEVVFGIATAPPAGATLEQLFCCLDWLAPGFEIVQSHCPDWKFSAAETVADSGLHARLWVGPRTPVRRLASGGSTLDARLGAATVELGNDGTAVARGHGRDVLDGPLHALHHLVAELERTPGAPPLRAGDVVTTGTWADAWPLRAGERWRADFGTPLGAIEVTVGG